MGDVYMLNGKILSGLPNHAKNIIFDNTDTTLSSTNTENAIKEVNSNLTKYNQGARVSLVGTTSVNPYIAPSDGYICVINSGSNTGFVAIDEEISIGGAIGRYGTFVRKNSHSYVNGTCDAAFYVRLV